MKLIRSATVAGVVAFSALSGATVAHAQDFGGGVIGNIGYTQDLHVIGVGIGPYGSLLKGASELAMDGVEYATRWLTRNWNCDKYVPASMQSVVCPTA